MDTRKYTIVEVGLKNPKVVIVEHPATLPVEEVVLLAYCHVFHPRAPETKRWEIGVKTDYMSVSTIVEHTGVVKFHDSSTTHKV